MSRSNGPRQSGIFITGADTGVGKTYVGVRLIHALLAQGMQVAPRKPVESGCERRAGKLIPTDALALYEAAGRPGSLDGVCRYRLRHPLSPERAARLEGIRFSIDDLVSACRDDAGEDDFLLVEGAGGFYSPLAEDGLNADLAMALRLPVLIIAADRLGCLNHVLLTVDAVRRRRLNLAAVALNCREPVERADMDNTADLMPRLDCPLVRIGHGDDARAGIARLAALFTVPV